LGPRPDFGPLLYLEFFRVLRIQSRCGRGTLEPLCALTEEKKMKVLVIGGGQAGLGVAVALRKKDKSLEVSMVDPKDYFEVRWATLRAMVALNRRSATLASGGEAVPFDVCVIAVGAKCPTLGVDPIATELELRKEELVSMGKQLVSGDGDVLLIGGGTLGCELAGEVLNPVQEAGHKVIIAQSTPELVPGISEKGRKLTTKVLERLGAEVLTGNRANEVDGKWVVGEKVFESATVVNCTGYRARNNFMAVGNLGTDCVTEKGWINTDESEGADGRIFAFGDCCTTGANIGTVITSNYGAIVHNITAKLEELGGGKEKKLKPCSNFITFMSVLTLGPENGVAALPFVAFEWLLPAFKNKTMFIDNAMSSFK